MLVAPSWNMNYAMHTECGVYIYIYPAITLLWTVCSATGENHVSRAAHAQQLHVPHVCTCDYDVIHPYPPQLVLVQETLTNITCTCSPSCLTRALPGPSAVAMNTLWITENYICNVETCIVNYVYYKMCLN